MLEGYQVRKVLYVKNKLAISIHVRSEDNNVFLALISLKGGAV